MSGSIILDKDFILTAKEFKDICARGNIQHIQITTDYQKPMIN